MTPHTCDSAERRGFTSTDSAFSGKVNAKPEWSEDEARLKLQIMGSASLFENRLSTPSNRLSMRIWQLLTRVPLFRIFPGKKNQRTGAICCGEASGRDSINPGPGLLLLLRKTELIVRFGPLTFATHP